LLDDPVHDAVIPLAAVSARPAAGGAPPSGRPEGEAATAADTSPIAGSPIDEEDLRILLRARDYRAAEGRLLAALARFPGDRMLQHHLTRVRALMGVHEDLAAG
jgi:hypothetical protein